MTTAFECIYGACRVNENKTDSNKGSDDKEEKIEIVAAVFFHGHDKRYRCFYFEISVAWVAVPLSTVTHGLCIGFSYNGFL